MRVYAVFREGVYRHECGGIYSTEAEAEACARWLAQIDGDRRHRYVVVPFALDKRPEVEASGLGPRDRSPSIAEDEPVFSIRKGDAV